jgi:hypothetical protein
MTEYARGGEKSAHLLPGIRFLQENLVGLYLVKV